MPTKPFPQGYDLSEAIFERAFQAYLRLARKWEAEDGWPAVPEEVLRKRYGLLCRRAGARYERSLKGLAIEPAPIPVPGRSGKQPPVVPAHSVPSRKLLPGSVPLP